MRNILCNTAAFGGVNTAIVVGSCDSHQSLSAAHPEATSRVKVVNDSQTNALDEIVITGIGMVSAIGCGMHARAEAFSESHEPFSRNDRRLGEAAASLKVGLAQGFSPRKHCPMVKLRGLEALTQYAAGATALALKDANLEQPRFDPERVGVVSGITRSSGHVFHQLFTELAQDSFRPSVGKLMLRNGRFMIASQLADWFAFKGHTSTLSIGVGCGLHSLASAYDQLRHDTSLDAMIVVACDELSYFTLKTMGLSEYLVPQNDQWRIYDSERSGYVPGEGAVCVVLERRKLAESRGQQQLATITGAGTTFDGLPGDTELTNEQRPAWECFDPSGQMLAQSYAIACEQAGIDAGEIDLVMGNGNGISDWDSKEVNALESYFDTIPKFACVNGHTGFCESASPLFNLAAAVSYLKSDVLPSSPHTAGERCNSADKVAPVRSNKPANVLVSASSEHGNNACVLLSRNAQDSTNDGTESNGTS